MANSTPNGESYPPLVTMDGSGYDYMTAAVASSFFDDSGGLPDNGSYAANSDHPTVQLAFDDGDASGKPNSFILNRPSDNIKTVTFPVAMTSFSTVQIYGTSTEGSSSLTVTLTYTDNSTDVTSFTVPDWFQSFSASSPVFVVQGGLSRLSSAGYDYFSENQEALYGATVPANKAKTLASVTLTTAGSGRFVLYGATAY